MPKAARERWSVLPLLRTTAEYLDARGIDEPRLSAEHLLAHVLACRRLDLYLGYDRPIAPDELAAYRTAVRRRLRGEPIQYITGRAGFRGLDLEVDSRVLIPRPETEMLVSEVLAWARGEAERGRAPIRGWRILDVGTGSGAIAIALALEMGTVGVVVGSDLSRGVVDLAYVNAIRAGAGRAAFVVADGFAGFRRGAFDVVVSNPPYLADGERATLPREVRDWEPPVALYAGPRGDEAIARIVAGSPGYLRPGGLLALEVAMGQAAAVRERMRAGGLVPIATFRDAAGIERGVLAVPRT